MRTKPDFFIIGVQKSATTFLHRCLAAHPDIGIISGGLSYFTDPEYGQLSRDDYEKQFDGVRTAKIFGHKKPNFFTMPEVAARLHEYAPEAKLLVILRDPVKRAISAYFHLMRHGFLPVRPVMQGLEAVLAGDYDLAYPRARTIISSGYYSRHLKRFLQYFNREQIMVLIQEEFLADRHEALPRIYKFLGAVDNCEPRMLRLKANPGVYSLTRLRFLNCMNRHVFRLSADGFQNEFIPGNYLYRGLYYAIRMIDHLFLRFFCEQDKPVLEERLTAKLKAFYLDDINELEKILGRNDLNKLWLKPGKD